MFEPWNARSDSKNMEFNNVVFLKWYTQLIDATQRMCHTTGTLESEHNKYLIHLESPQHFFWPRHAKPSNFNMRPLPFYLDEETLDKEVMSWSELNATYMQVRNALPFLSELLKKKSSIEEAGLSTEK
jgi:hypothetical protein